MIPHEVLERLSPATRNLVGLIGGIPVMVLKKDAGRNRPSRVVEEIKSLDGRGFRVFQNGDDLCVVAEGSGRTFLV